MPGVEDGVAALGHEEHAEGRLTGSAQAWHPILVNQAYEMEIVGQFAARHERPAATQPEPAVHGPSYKHPSSWGLRTPHNTVRASLVFPPLLDCRTALQGLLQLRLRAPARSAA